MPDNMGSWYFHLNRQSLFAVVPHRLPIAVLVLLAGAPWIRWHFSLRTLLIAVTVIALVLGLAIYFGR